MTDRSPHLAEALASLLPDLPEDEDWGTVPEGDDWIRELPATGWHAIGVWGPQGWDLGAWPHQIVAHYDPPQGIGVYGVAEYTEGDVTVQAFESREERDAETDALALALWRQLDNGPHGLSPEDTALPPHLRGPYQPA